MSEIIIIVMHLNWNHIAKFSAQRENVEGTFYPVVMYTEKNVNERKQKTQNDFICNIDEYCSVHGYY